MAVKIKFRGFELEVPPEELAEVLRQLREFAPDPLPEAESLVRPGLGVRVGLPRPSTVRHVWPGPMFASEEREVGGVDEEDVRPLSEGEAHEMTMRFLSALADEAAVLRGLDTEEVAKLLAVKHPKGIGSRSAVVNKIIAGAGFDVAEVYRNPRDSTGARKWFRGPALRDALAVLMKGKSQPG